MAKKGDARRGAQHSSDQLSAACDVVRLTLVDGQQLQGVVMPNSTDATLVLKLSSGYNVGIARSRIRTSDVMRASHQNAAACAQTLDPPVAHAVIVPSSLQSAPLKTIAILHTGGTVASKVDYATGGVSSRFTPEELLQMYPELGAVAKIRSRLIRNMFSEDMRFAHYNLIADAILEEIQKGVDGVIVTHGTDTLGYTGAALSFMLENLRTPVILVGSQRSADRGSSDAALNLLCACVFISRSDFGGVGICMHAGLDDVRCAILPGLKARKMHSSRRDAFRAVNALPIAFVARTGEVEVVARQYVHRDPAVVPVVKHFKPSLKIGLLKMHPQMHTVEVLAYKDFDGLVIEGTGMGHAPVNVIDDATKEHAAILKAIATLAGRMPVVMATQTIFGRVNMDVYSTGRLLQDAGVIGNMSDMHAETAFIKLAWLLSQHPAEKVRALFGQNLRGEISERSIIGDVSGPADDSVTS